MAQRAIARVLGLVRHDGQERLTPLLPSVLHFNVEPHDQVAAGDVVEIRVRVEVQSLVPAPIPEV